MLIKNGMSYFKFLYFPLLRVVSALNHAPLILLQWTFLRHVLVTPF